MKKLLNVLFYFLTVLLMASTISSYQTLDLVEMILFTVMMFMLGCVVTLDILNLVAKLAKEKSGE
uniref:Uncharacterized protein n=1 Tax=Siphoviridae sp. ctqSm5 TaxID=2827949 RepID=A0A8S5SNY5_9CAUD|nr:MAG TPA: hypothetical protein [Siphoviridae sp. ctqSm5]